MGPQGRPRPFQDTPTASGLPMGPQYRTHPFQDPLPGPGVHQGLRDLVVWLSCAVASMEGSLGDGAKDKPFHTATPLLESWALSQVAGVKVFLKCENVQPSGSFKIRGIGHLVGRVSRIPRLDLALAVTPFLPFTDGEEGMQPLRGNAGISAAYAARKLGIAATIVLPEGTSPQVVRRLQGEGAEVQLHGKVWDEANLRAQELAKRDGWVNIPPFDHPLLWEGHGSLVQELKAALGTPPGAVVLAVGGGGLLAGVAAGLVEVGWQHVPIIAMETRGAHCLNAAIKAGRPVTLPGITSVAKCLGAKTVATRAFECTQEFKVLSEVVEDVEAVNATQRFLDDERMLVEPACGAALAAVYSGLLGRLQAEGHLSPSLSSVVVIVCGGNSIDSQELQALKAMAVSPACHASESGTFFRAQYESDLLHEAPLQCSQ
ncbi:Serine dehydratase-like protein [Tupaia chinensis]|uniref:L-serine deaminase n=1 Tax=Tupaia chinensis TaxID=246437 RepID=L9KMJ9_TUPCH|nr:Serine dehydratase-like protein [Tupaia chinensis]